ncbi:MAG: Urease gamma subunit, partial [uncultured Adhaeribacter sp.]
KKYRSKLLSPTVPNWLPCIILSA